MVGYPESPPGWRFVRLVMGVVILTAVAAQATVTIAEAADAGRDVATTATNVFSFFTIWANLVGGVVLVWAGARPDSRSDARGRRHPQAVALACATTYLAVTGLVYNLLLRGIELDQVRTVGWANEVMHLIGPAFLVIDLLLAQRRPVGRRAVGIIIAFPLVWIGYTLVRGPLVTHPLTGQGWWYPYPFLDPHLAGGWRGVLGYVVAIAVTMTVIAGLVVRRTTHGVRTACNGN